MDKSMVQISPKPTFSYRREPILAQAADSQCNGASLRSALLDVLVDGGE
jgi:hypothetical protein